MNKREKELLTNAIETVYEYEKFEKTFDEVCDSLGLTEKEKKEFVLTYSYRCLFDLSIGDKIKLIDKLVKYDKKLEYLHVTYNTKEMQKYFGAKDLLNYSPDEDLIAIYDNEVLSVNFDEFEAAFNEALDKIVDVYNSIY